MVEGSNPPPPQQLSARPRLSPAGQGDDCAAAQGNKGDSTVWPFAISSQGLGTTLG